MFGNFFENLFDKSERLGKKLELEMFGGLALIIDVFVTLYRSILATQWPEQSWWQHALQAIQIFLGGVGYCLVAAYLILFAINFFLLTLDSFESWRKGIKNPEPAACETNNSKEDQ